MAQRNNKKLGSKQRGTKDKHPDFFESSNWDMGLNWDMDFKDWGTGLKESDKSKNKQKRRKKIK